MPIYEYECSDCGHHLEELQTMSEAPLVKCPECGKDTLKRLIGGGGGLIFKGSGFYLTDYKNKPAESKTSKGKDSTTETKTDGSKETKKSESSSAESKSVESKPAENKAAQNKTAENKSSEQANKIRK